MASEWFIQDHGTEAGPFSSDEIRKKASDGEIEPTTQIRRREGEWGSASQIRGLEFRTMPADNIFGTKPAASRKPPALPPLVPCPDCGEQCSRRAVACPNCGCPVSLAMPSHAMQLLSIGRMISSGIGILLVVYYAAIFKTERDGIYNIGLIAEQQIGVLVGIGLQIVAAFPSVKELFG